jgi:hypothetical protein
VESAATNGSRGVEENPMVTEKLRTGTFLGAIALALFGCSSAEQSAEGDESLASSSAELSTSLASQLNGVMLTSPCVRLTDVDVCSTIVNAPCPAANPDDPALSGTLLTDKTVTLGGVPWRTYSVTLRIQGVVEAKTYANSVDSNGTATSPTANGFSVGGKPVSTNAYNVFMIRANNPRQDYFLNSVAPPGVSNHTTYGVDYTATIRARGQSTIRLVASDSNCSMIKNCGPTATPGACAAPITLVPTPTAVAANPAVNFNVASTGQWLVMTVTAVN